MEISGVPVAKGVLTPTAKTSLPAADIRRANAVMITVETQVVRVSMTGDDVTATTDHVLAVGGPYFFKGAELIAGLEFIDTAAGASKVRYTTLR